MTSKTKPQRERVFIENPFDLETFFESLSISTDHDKELIFMDRLFAEIRTNPHTELADLCYNVLRGMDLLTLKRP